MSRIGIKDMKKMAYDQAYNLATANETRKTASAVNLTPVWSSPVARLLFGNFARKAVLCFPASGNISVTERGL